MSLTAFLLGTYYLVLLFKYKINDNIENINNRKNDTISKEIKVFKTTSFKFLILFFNIKIINENNIL